VKVFFTPAANADLTSIGNWIAKDNPRRAASFLIELRNACRTIGDAPKGSVVVQRYLDHDVRRKTFREYLIFYRIKNNQIEILHVMHGSRDYSSLI
jgi:toxin ParE1/3/4